MSSLLPSALLRAAGMCALVPLMGTVAPDAPPAAPVPCAAPRDLVATGGGALSRSYRLPVLAVMPEVPADVRGDPGLAVATSASGCPVEVRGIAWSERGAFAVLVAGEQRAAVEVGDRMRLGLESLMVTAIGRDQVTIRSGNAELRCPLGE